MPEAQVTTDHETIRRWVEQRGGSPATVKGTAPDDQPGLLRVDFPEEREDRSLERIDWDAFFEKFEQSNLAFLYQETTEEGGISRFCKFVSRD